MQAMDAMSAIEYIVVPKQEWELLNKDLEIMQDIIKVQSRELNIIKGKDFLQFERVQEEMVIRQFARWMRDRQLMDCDVHDLVKRNDFSAWLRHIQLGCEKARVEYMERMKLS